MINNNNNHYTMILSCLNDLNSCRNCIGSNTTGDTKYSPR